MIKTLFERMSLWPNGHVIWLEIWGSEIQIPTGVGPQRVKPWQGWNQTPLTTFDPGLPQKAQNMIPSQDLKVSEMINFARQKKYFCSSKLKLWVSVILIPSKN